MKMKKSKRDRSTRQTTKWILREITSYHVASQVSSEYFNLILKLGMHAEGPKKNFGIHTNEPLQGKIPDHYTKLDHFFNFSRPVVVCQFQQIEIGKRTLKLVFDQSYHWRHIGLDMDQILNSRPFRTLWLWYFSIIIMINETELLQKSNQVTFPPK